MTESWCERHDWPLYQCPPECREGFKPRHRETPASPPDYEGPRPGPDAILISPTGIAHHLGCTHLPDYEYIAPPRWGWSNDPNSVAQIGSHEVRANEGNLD